MTEFFFFPHNTVQLRAVFPVLIFSTRDIFLLFARCSSVRRLLECIAFVLCLYTISPYTQEVNAQQPSDEKHYPSIITNSTPVDSTAYQQLQCYLDSAKRMQYVNALRQEYFAREAQRIAIHLRDTLALIESYLQLAGSFSARAMRFRDVEAIKKALVLAQRRYNTTALSRAYNQLSNSYRLLLRYDSATTFAERAMFYANKTHDSVLYMIAWGNWAQVRVRKREYEAALPIFENLKHFFARRGLTGEYIGTVSRIGYVKGLQGDRLSEIAYYREGYALSQQQGLRMMTAEVGSTLGAAEFYLQRYDSAIIKLNQSLQLAYSLEMFELIEENHLYLSRAFEALNKPSEALYHYKQFVNTVKRPSIGSDGEQQDLELRRYEELIGDQQILLLKREAEKQRLERTVISGILALVIVMTTIGILLWRREIRRRERIQHQQLQMFASYTSDVITCHDLQGLYTYISPSMTAMLGYTSEELLGKNPYPYIHPDDVEGVKKSYKAMITTKTTGRHQCRFRNKNGDYKWIEVTYKPVLSDAGDITAYIHSTRDVHERVEAEQKLRASQEALRATLFNTPNVSVQWYDSEGKIVLWNKASETMYGWSEQEVLGKTLEDIHFFIHEAEYQEFQHTIQHILTTDEPVGPYQYQFRRKDGSLGFGESANFAIPISDTPDIEKQRICVCMDIDITTRYHAETALQQANDDLDAMLRMMGVGVAVNVENRYVFTNEKFRTILGYTEQEFHSLLVIEEIVHPDDRTTTYRRYRERLQGIDSHHQAVEARYRHKNGHYVWLEISGLLFTYQGKKATLVTFIDITERRAAEHRLRKNEAEVRAVLESTKDQIYSLDTTYHLLTYNSAYAESARKIFNVTLQPGIDVMSFVPIALVGKPEALQEEHRIWKERYNRCLAGERFSVVYSQKLGDTIHYFEHLYNPIYDADGNIVGIVAFNRDISEMKRAEEQIKHSERILRQTGQMAKVGGWEIDLIGEQRLVRCTETTLDIFGRPPETEPTWEMLLSHYDNSFHPMLESIIQKAIHSQETQEYEAQITTFDGKRRWMYSQVHIEQRGDQALRLFGAIQDITERKEAELLIQQQLQALEEKNAEMERFTYTVSHDLKSPLITIRGFLGMIQEDIQEGDFSRVSKDLLRIDNAATKMQHLLEDLLELSRIGRVINPQETFSMTVLANETVELLEGIVKQRNVTVRVQADMPTIVADKERFREVYQNLIENATKFMGRDNAHPLIEIGCGYDDIEPIFFVRDNGIGIAKQYQQTIFGLFDKLDQHSDGTGIGLALVKRIVELHGGRIWVESEQGNGSTFYFTCKQNTPQNSTANSTL